LPPWSLFRRDPFEALNLGFDQVEQYLSDAQTRLTHSHLWSVNTNREIVQLGQTESDSHETLDKLMDVQRDMQEKMTDKVFPFRNHVLDMARTLWEILCHTQSGEEDLVTECNEQLDNAVTTIEDAFKMQRAELARIAESNHSRMMEHSSAHQKAEDSAAQKKIFSVGLSVFAGIGGCLVLASCFSPKLLSKVASVKSWYRPDYKEGDRLFYKRIENSEHIDVWPICGLGILAASIAKSLYRSACAWRAKAKKEELCAKAASIHKLNAGQNRTMWEGMFMSVENLRDSISQLRNMDPRRKHRRECTIQDICSRVFHMSMAVDEYIMWLSDRDYFPPNYSVRGALGPARYDTIQSVFDKVKSGEHSVFKVKPASAEGGALEELGSEETTVIPSTSMQACSSTFSWVSGPVHAANGNRCYWSKTLFYIDAGSECEISVPAAHLQRGSWVKSASKWVCVDAVTVHMVRQCRMYRFSLEQDAPSLTVTSKHRIVTDLARPNGTKVAEDLQEGDNVFCMSSGRLVQKKLYKVEQFLAENLQLVQVSFTPDEPVLACDPPLHDIVLSRSSQLKRKGGIGGRHDPDDETASIHTTEYSWV